MELNKLGYSRQKARQILTLVIFFILLIGRLLFSSDQLLWHPSSYGSFYEFSYNFIAYVLVSMIIWVNRNNLELLNIDKPFILLFIFSGIILSIFYLPPAVGFLNGLIVLLNFRLYRRDYFRFSKVKQNNIQVSAIVIIALIPNLLFYVWQLFAIGFHESESIWLILFDAGFPVLVFEEVVFRGLLWMFLKKLKLNIVAIIILQGFLFWMAHLYYFSEPFTFWLWLPWTSMWLGIIVWRSKSITQSTLTHFAINLLDVLMVR